MYNHRTPLAGAGGDRGRSRDVEAPRRSEGAKERDQVALLLAGQFGAEHQIEELNRIIERQQASVVQVGRRILDTAQREGLDGSIPDFIQAIDHLRLEESLGLEIVHQVVRVVRRRVAAAALAFAKENLLTAYLGLRCLAQIELPEDVEFRCRWEAQLFLELRHQVHLG